MKTKNGNAYFSVEAALVLPMAIAVILLAVCLFVFQYDRCLLEQDMAAQALRGAAAEAKTKEELTEKIQRYSEGLYLDKYVAWDMAKVEVKLKRGILEAAAQGELQVPLPDWIFWSGGNSWNVRAVYKAHRICPVTFIRNFSKLKGGH